jgi:ribosome-binding factor A
MASQRMRRVDGSVREVLAAAIADEVTDPGDTAEQQATLDALNRAKRLLQSSIARALRLKYTPVLEFHMDDSARRAVRIDALLRSDEAPTPPPEDPR